MYECNYSALVCHVNLLFALFITGIITGARVQLYSKVRVLMPVCVYTGTAFLIQFDVSRFSRVRWEHSRRLIYGSLLCFSQDNFRSVCFASVIKRDAAALQSGQLVVKFEGDDFNPFTIDPSTEFQMVESSAYFEAYRHALRCLQLIRPEQMPFKPYIVGGYCKGESIKPPSYLRPDASLDLNSVLKPKGPLRRIDITKPLLPRWTSVFDESQLAALQMALSQEISVIQGPPGTGKTYIGLKIVEALLQNRTVWDKYNNSPILVVCYTNHALDQFLEGVLDLKVGHQEEKPKVVRVGGRCKNEKVGDCVMAKLVSKLKSDHAVPTHLYKRIKDNRSKMKTQQDSIETALKAIDANEGKILTLDELGMVIDEHHYHQLKSIETSAIPPDKIIDYWLGLWFVAGPQIDEDDDIQAAVADSLALEDNGSNEIKGGLVIEGIEEEGGGNFIDVLDEPQLLEEDRIIEGEEEINVMPFLKTKEEPKQREAKVTAGEGGWQVKQLDSKKRKNLIKDGFKNRPFNADRASRVTDVWKIDDIKKRWRLYQYWLNKYIRQSKGSIKYTADQYNRLARECQEIDQEVNTITLSGASVVGVTTTGAAKHSYIFKYMNPKIVIVEEAAEVMESHIVTSLCSSVQQLIMIGDHKQLQPKVTHYELEKNYGFHISLFERLIFNDVPVATLTEQHRMRPEIASIVGNHIYDRLDNHESVYTYGNVKGIGKNLFFIDHHRPENENPTGDVRSHANTFEAKYVVALTRYLLKQGYQRSDITILTMYRGQLFEIKQNMRKDEFDGVRVAAVDDFQGEENEIIILSLVRSNDDGRIGFLKVENRVCVALSRAKAGLFVIGNLSMLRSKDTTKWPAILNQMDREGHVGDGLPLCCQVHPKEVTIAKEAEDFSKCPEGGCLQKCGFRLDCGHVCRSPCHPIDQEHKSIYKCQQSCSKMLPCGHKCIRKCFECLDGCLQCQTVVKKLLNCGHPVKIKCHKDPSEVSCNSKCSRILDCGHQCWKKCSEPCGSSSTCKTKESRRLPCGHSVSIPCSTSENEFICTVPCNKTLDCGHNCVGTCGKCSQGRLHVACASKCDRTLACGHRCFFSCTSSCPPCRQLCNNYCHHSQCRKLCYEPCIPCRELCQWKCKHYTCTAKCGEPCNRPRCNRPCTKSLKCGHPCIGLCGEECPKFCRICNGDQVKEIFFGEEDEDDALFIQLKDCSHIFEVKAMDHWMDVAAQGTDSGQFIKYIECPKCKTPIHRSLRYGNIIKHTIADMEAVKKQVLRNNTEASQLLREVLQIQNDIKFCTELSIIFGSITKRLESASSNARRGMPLIFPHEAVTVKNQVDFLPHIAKIYKLLHSLPNAILFPNRLQIEQEILIFQTTQLVGFLNTNYLTPQQSESAKGEVMRLHCLSQLCSLQAVINKERRKLEQTDQQDIIDQARFLLSCGQGGNSMLTDEQSTAMQKMMRSLGNKYSIGGVTKEELAIIVKAMADIQKGAWYKCPNGHFYAIGECGGATQVGKCPECGAAIGGQGHRLLSDNAHAGEIDNSSHAAWSEGANLANYDLQHLF